MVQAAAQRRRLGAARRGGPETGATEDGRAASSAAKTCAILRAFAARSPLRLTDIAAATGLNKVTALRIVETLIEEGFVAREERGPRLRAGPRDPGAGGHGRPTRTTSGRSRGRASCASPTCPRTPLLSVRSGPNSVCIDRQVGSFPIRANYLDVGSRRPLGRRGGRRSRSSPGCPTARSRPCWTRPAPRLAPYPGSSPRHRASSSPRAGRAATCSCSTAWWTAWARSASRCSTTPAPSSAALSIAALTERIVERADTLAAALRREADLVRRELAGARRIAEGS